MFHERALHSYQDAVLEIQNTRLLGSRAEAPNRTRGPPGLAILRYLGARLANMRWSVRRCMLSWRAVSETFRSQDS